METENTQKELDLIDLIKICWGWFVSYIWKPFLALFGFAIRKWWVVLLSALVGFGISYAISTFLPRYVGTIIYENNVAHSSDFINSIRPLTKASPSYVASALNIPMDEAAYIIAIAPHALYYADTLQTTYYVDMDDKAPKQSSSLPKRFAIEISAFRLKSFDHLQEGFRYYFSNLSFYNDLHKRRMSYLDADAKLAKSEMEKLAEIRDANSGSKAGMVLSGGDMYPVMDPSTISKELFKLNEISENTTGAIKYDTGVLEVVTPLIVDRYPANFFMYTYKKWVVVCVVMGLFIALCISYRKKIKAYIFS